MGWVEKDLLQYGVGVKGSLTVLGGFEKDLLQCGVGGKGSLTVWGGWYRISYSVGWVV